MVAPSFEPRRTAALAARSMRHGNNSPPCAAADFRTWFAICPHTATAPRSPALPLPTVSSPPPTVRQRARALSSHWFHSCSWFVIDFRFIIDFLTVAHLGTNSGAEIISEATKFTTRQNGVFGSLVWVFGKTNPHLKNGKYYELVLFGVGKRSPPPPILGPRWPRSTRSAVLVL